MDSPAPRAQNNFYFLQARLSRCKLSTLVIGISHHAMTTYVSFLQYILVRPKHARCISSSYSFSTIYKRTFVCRRNFVSVRRHILRSYGVTRSVGVGTTHHIPTIFPRNEAIC